MTPPLLFLAGRSRLSVAALRGGRDGAQPASRRRARRAVPGDSARWSRSSSRSAASTTALEREPRVLLPARLSRLRGRLLPSRAAPIPPFAARATDRRPPSRRSRARSSWTPASRSGNAKVNRLSAAASARARYRHILMADGNVRVHPEFLGRAVSFFAIRRWALVSHLFRARGASDAGLAARVALLERRAPAGTAAIAGLLGIAVRRRQVHPDLARRR